jgi:hypothetical protein
MSLPMPGTYPVIPINWHLTSWKTPMWVWHPESILGTMEKGTCAFPMPIPLRILRKGWIDWKSIWRVVLKYKYNQITIAKKTNNKQITMTNPPAADQTIGF